MDTICGWWEPSVLMLFVSIHLIYPDIQGLFNRQTGIIESVLKSLFWKWTKVGLICMTCFLNVVFMYGSDPFG